jgi:hypothetical protein
VGVSFAALNDAIAILMSVQRPQLAHSWLTFIPAKNSHSHIRATYCAQSTHSACTTSGTAMCLSLRRKVMFPSVFARRKGDRLRKERIQDREKCQGSYRDGGCLLKQCHCRGSQYHPDSTYAVNRVTLLTIHLLRLGDCPFVSMLCSPLTVQSSPDSTPARGTPHFGPEMSDCIQRNPIGGQLEASLSSHSS